MSIVYDYKQISLKMLGGEIGNFAIQYGRGDHQWGQRGVEGVVWSVGADDCVHVVFRDIGVVLVVMTMNCDGVERVDMEGGGSTRSGLRLKVVKMVFTLFF